MEIWKEFLTQDIVSFLYKAEKLPKEEFFIPDEIWVEIIYSFAVAAHKKMVNKEHLLKSLTPLYIGKTASFVTETLESSASDVEEKIEKLCMCFEKEKRFLITNWN